MSKAKGRLQFLGLLLVFLLPVVAVGWLYWSGWNPGGTSYGALVQPPRELAVSSMQNYAAAPFKPEDWRDKWHLVQISSAACGARCQQDLYEMRQIHASLAKEIERLQRVWLVAGELPEADLQAARKQYPDLVILPAAAKLAQQFQQVGQPDDRYYLVDPLGKIVMRYPHDAEAKGIRKDLLKLFRYSWAG
jgi:hypothetical protein